MVLLVRSRWSAANSVEPGDIYEIGGNLSLEFDTRPAGSDNPDGPFAAIIVSGGNLRIPGFTLTDASMEITVDNAGLHINHVQGESSLLD